MEDLKSTTIVPISCYCFILGAYLAFLAISVALGNRGALPDDGVIVGIAVTGCAIFGCGLIAVGFGFLKMNKMCWRILFFSMAICVSCLASLLIAFMMILAMDLKFLLPYFKTVKLNSVEWFSFLGVFLSEIIVLYYLCSEDVLTSFGDMGPLISPF